METAIIVPLDRRDSIDPILAFVDSIAKPGMRVVFLVRSSADNWERMEAYLTVMQTGNQIALANCGARESAALANEKQLAEARLATVSENLRRKGLETEVRIYAGGLKKILGKLAENGNVRFVMVPASGSRPFFSFLRSIARAFNPVKRPVFSPLLLIHPDNFIARPKGS